MARNNMKRPPRHKLTPDQVRAIRVDMRFPRVIAKEYGVLTETIDKIQSGKAWRHLE